MWLSHSHLNGTLLYPKKESIGKHSNIVTNEASKPTKVTESGSAIGRLQHMNMIHSHLQQLSVYIHCNKLNLMSSSILSLRTTELQLFPVTHTVSLRISWVGDKLLFCWNASWHSTHDLLAMKILCSEVRSSLFDQNTTLNCYNLDKRWLSSYFVFTVNQFC